MINSIKKAFATITRVLKTPASELFNFNSLQWKFGNSGYPSRLSQNSGFLKWDIEPSQVAKVLRAFFMIATASILLWLVLSFFQFPYTQAGKSSMTFYETGLKNDPSHLFSKKIIQLDGIKIQGLIITKDLPENSQGYVIFDIDGKNVGPIEVGETFGKGLFLQAITKNSATITFQGQKSTIYLYPEDNPSAPKK
jgi:hypothetical protein